MRQVKISVIERALDISDKICAGEATSQYQRAFSTCDLLIDRFIRSLNKGVSRSDIVSYLMIAADVEKRIASNTLSQKLKKIGYKAKVEEDDEVIPSDDEPNYKSEVSVEVGGSKPKQATAAAVAPKVAAVVPKTEIQPVEKKVTFSASTDIDKPAAKPLVVDPNDKWAHLRGGGVIGKGFIGEEEKWMTPEEIQADKERRARIEASSIKSAEMDKERKLKEQLNNQNV